MKIKKTNDSQHLGHSTQRVSENDSTTNGGEIA